MVKLQKKSKGSASINTDLRVVNNTRDALLIFMDAWAGLGEVDATAVFLRLLACKSAVLRVMDASPDALKEVGAAKAGVSV